MPRQGLVEIFRTRKVHRNLSCELAQVLGIARPTTYGLILDNDGPEWSKKIA